MIYTTFGIVHEFGNSPRHKLLDLRKISRFHLPTEGCTREYQDEPHEIAKIDQKERATLDFYQIKFEKSK